VVGLASSVLFDKENPRSPVNRRISIVVMTREADAEAKLTDLPNQVADAADLAVPGESAAPAEPAPESIPIASATSATH
jgi:chemotaxis protein MotB